MLSKCPGFSVFGIKILLIFMFNKAINTAEFFFTSFILFQNTNMPVFNYPTEFTDLIFHI